MIATDEQDLVREILALTGGEGTRIVLDPVGGPTVEKPIIARTFPLEEIARAHRYLESNQQIGKIVVKV